MLERLLQNHIVSCKVTKFKVFYVHLNDFNYFSLSLFPSFICIKFVRRFYGLNYDLYNYRVDKKERNDKIK